MGHARLPWVQRCRKRYGMRYRACRMLDGIRRYGQLRANPAQAHEDAVAMGKAHEPPPAGVWTFADAVAAVEDEMRTKRSAGTLEAFQESAAVLQKYWLPDLPLAQVSQAGIELFIRARLKTAVGKSVPPKRYVSASTVVTNLRALSRLLRLAMKRGHLKANPLVGVDLPRVDRRQMDFFSPGELAALLRRIRDGRKEHEAHADLIELLFRTGLRRAEACRLHRGDVDLENGRLLVRGKTGRRELPATGELEQVLRRMLLRASGDKLLPGGEEYVTTVFRRWRERLKEPRLHSHAMRHSAATAMVAAGVDVHTIATVLGHRGLTMVMRYLHARGEAVRSALQALQLPGQPVRVPSSESGEARSGS